MGDLHLEEPKGSIYWQLIPFGLNLKEVIKKNHPSFNYSFDFFIHLLHLTIQIPARNKELRRKDGFVPLNAAILQSINRDYHLHLDYLVKQGILETDGQYFPGHKSRCYRIQELYLKKCLLEIFVSDKRLTKHLAKEYALDFRLRRKYGYLQQWFNDKLQIDDKSALLYCMEELKQNTYQHIHEHYQKVHGKIAMVKMLQHGQYYFTEDKFGHRIHTNLTNLGSDLKQFIKYNGEELVSIDITNSQPYLSVKILGEKYPQVILYYKEHPIYGKSFMLVNDAEALDSIDVYHFIFLVVSGQLYEYLVKEMRREFGDEYFLRPVLLNRAYFKKKSKNNASGEMWIKNNKDERKLAKDVFFEVVYSKNTQHTREKKLFKKLFPNVMHVFETYKKELKTHKQKSHKKLSRMLQQIEANIVVREVAKIISDTLPHIPLYTIHDNLVTTVSHKETVAKILYDALLKHVGLPPSLVFEYWNKEKTKIPVAIAA